MAAGADGLIIEVHNPDRFDRLMGELRIIAPVLGRSVPLARG